MGATMRFAFLVLTSVLLVCPAIRAQTPAPPLQETPADKAIKKALDFLQRTQDPIDGAWKSGASKNAAITSLAVMAFLSAGHVPGEGRYGETITKGVRWVLAQQQENGLLATDQGHEMYHHGIATLMLAEVAGMTDDKLGREIREKLTKAIRLILKAQRTEGPGRGGWRYAVEHREGSDISVSGWQIMALRAARNLGCDVPAETIERAVTFLQSCHDPVSGGFCYMPDHSVTVPCTGTSILALELCGKNQHRSPVLLKAGSYLLRNPPRWGQAHFFYSVYYGSQATFQLGDGYWNVYRPMLHEVLLQNQLPNGSWIGASYDGAFGPNYCTSMAVLALTVEYRYLPIYQREENPKGK